MPFSATCNFVRVNSPIKCKYYIHLWKWGDEMDTPHSKQALDQIGVIRWRIETFSKARFYSWSLPIVTHQFPLRILLVVDNTKSITDNLEILLQFNVNDSLIDWLIDWLIDRNRSRSDIASTRVTIEKTNASKRTAVKQRRQSVPNSPLNYAHHQPMIRSGKNLEQVDEIEGQRWEEVCGYSFGLTITINLLRQGKLLEMTI